MFSNILVRTLLFDFPGALMLTLAVGSSTYIHENMYTYIYANILLIPVHTFALFCCTCLVLAVGLTFALRTYVSTYLVLLYMPHCASKYILDLHYYCVNAFNFVD